ncbi:efflux RND transporter periplasmic adaptor subunit [Streptococcus massiliensis]|uniref:ATP-binding cassette transporter-like protein n=1 Tax=Streptococcus massiliensis TaxID=313439 RepID=A0A380L2P6_9STRE|nr:efflux RND transporter periplasmic adaptor subunit [Streptococcus massiliensis]SUN77527.1 ATP-binding cassette transporter-like protein [Streptococcus massiliensis]
MPKNEKKQTNRRKIILVSAGALTCLCLGGYFLAGPMFGQNASTPTQKLQALTVQEAIDKGKKTKLVLAGEVAANNSSKIKIDTSKGEVKEVLVKNGDTVTAGQPLFRYSTSQELVAQSAQYDAAAKANAVGAAQNTAALKWATYNRKLAELNALKDKYNKSQDESLLEQIKSAEDALSQSLIDAKSSDNEVTNAQIESQKAQNTAQTEEEKTKYDTVTADTAGTITSLNADLPNQSRAKKDEETFIEILDKSKTFVKGNISEFDREKLTPGQKVEVVDRKDPKKRWTGTVTQVGNLTSDSKSGSGGGNGKQQEENPNQSKFPYKIELDKADNMPLIGSHTYVNVLESAPEAGKIQFPKSYTFTKNGKTYVWKIKDNKIHQQEVKTKEINKSTVEITEGLTMKDKISLPTEGLKEGMEVGQDVKA